MTLLAAILFMALTAEAAVVSWYGWSHQGKPTASGELFDCRKMTCASWKHPFGTWLTVRHNGRSVRVRVNDRGPAKHLRRDLDLSLAAFRRLEDPAVGLIRHATITHDYTNR